MYSELLQAFYRDRSAVGEVAQPTFRVMRKNALCGDSITLTGIVRNGVLVDGKFTAVGCMLSQAAASALMSRARGKPCTHIKQITMQNVLTVLGVSTLGPTRQQCVQLVLDAMQEALSEYD